MPSYMPCRTRQDDEVHLYPAGEAGRALCGKTAEDDTESPSRRSVCTECAKRLLIRVFRQSRSGDVSSVEFIVHE
jgi:hypothetical protein